MEENDNRTTTRKEFISKEKDTLKEKEKKKSDAKKIDNISNQDNSKEKAASASIKDQQQTVSKSNDTTNKQGDKNNDLTTNKIQAEDQSAVTNQINNNDAIASNKIIKEGELSTSEKEILTTLPPYSSTNDFELFNDIIKNDITSSLYQFSEAEEFMKSKVIKQKKKRTISQNVLHLLLQITEKH